MAPLLTLVKTANLNGALPEAGSDAIYTLVITQTGNSPAYAIKLSDLLPADVTYDAAASPQAGRRSPPSTTARSPSPTSC